MKNIEWLKEVTLKAKVDLLAKKNFGGYVHGYMDALTFFEDAMDDVGQVEQPALPEIPDYVAEYITYMKEEKTLVEVVHLSLEQIELGTGGAQPIDFWISRFGDKFSRAWLDGYTVEEKKYYILLPKIKRNWRYVSLRGNYDEFIDHYTDSIEDLQAFTEKEIKAVEPRYFAFAVPVEELD